MSPLPPDLREYLHEVVERCARLLGPHLVGVYAAGSVALESYLPGRSDVDLAVVCGVALTLPEKQSVVASLRHESLPCPARGLELVVYRSAIAAAAQAEPGFEVELNTGSRMGFRETYDGAERPERDGTFWYAIDRSILAQRGRSLRGPLADTVFRSVSDPTLVGLIIESMRWYGGVPAATDDAVFNACRGYLRARTGQWHGKAAAGELVLAEMSAGSGSLAGVLNPEVIRQSLAARTGGPAPDLLLAGDFHRGVLAALVQLRP